MGKIETFSIKLNKEQNVFKPGETVAGWLVVDLKECIKINYLKVSFIGRGHVFWTETKASSRHSGSELEIVIFDADESYFDNDFILWGNGNLDDSSLAKVKTSDADVTTEMPEGHHEFPISFTLPQDLPSSYESQMGFVRYLVKAKMSVPGKFNNCTTKAPFSVNSEYDLNTDRRAKEKICHREQRKVGCWCFDSGVYNINFSLDRRGYVPGERLCINAQVINHSGSAITPELSLCMTTHYHAKSKSLSSTSKSKTKTKTVDSRTCSTVQPRSDFVINETIRIPPLPPSNLTGCEAIDTKYHLWIKLSPGGCYGDNIEICEEIIIGTIPLGVTGSSLPIVDGAGGDPPPDVTEATMPRLPSDMPPPTYEECVFGKVAIIEKDDNDHTKVEMNFAPHYIYYNWDQNVNLCSTNQILGQPFSANQYLSRI
ncbi:arrestin domain-containing protein 2-like [Gigantopelta aegis]|uniref:arrestin domain-containing protein 2-like n=1 Tax=Gigantopelta aegis TaxID=1735272 RepID=UPI001B887D4D|nr:arrestin domain-containing protein 2-like [Gigantopelta aegis]XP_041368781.1 arrestin domain-containing protein 2-like [Gigantopelta aegis]